MVKIKRENWKNKYVFTARDDKGKILSWKNVKGSKQTLNQIKSIFKTNNSFDKNIFKKSEKLSLKDSALTEKVILKKSDIDKKAKILRKPKGKVVQYVVQGDYKGQTIAARSKKVLPNQKSDQLRQETWSSFLQRVAQIEGLDYDEDEGLKLKRDIKNIKEGWVSYV